MQIWYDHSRFHSYEEIEDLMGPNYYYNNKWVKFDESNITLPIYKPQPIDCLFKLKKICKNYIKDINMSKNKLKALSRKVQLTSYTKNAIETAPKEYNFVINYYEDGVGLLAQLDNAYNASHNPKPNWLLEDLI